MGLSNDEIRKRLEAADKKRLSCFKKKSLQRRENGNRLFGEVEEMGFDILGNFITRRYREDAEMGEDPFEYEGLPNQS